MVHIETITAQYNRKRYDGVLSGGVLTKVEKGIRFVILVYVLRYSFSYMLGIVLFFFSFLLGGGLCVGAPAGLGSIGSESKTATHGSSES